MILKQLEKMTEEQQKVCITISEEITKIEGRLEELQKTLAFEGEKASLLEDSTSKMNNIEHPPKPDVVSVALPTGGQSPLRRY